MIDVPAVVVMYKTKHLFSSHTHVRLGAYTTRCVPCYVHKWSSSEYVSVLVATAGILNYIDWSATGVSVEQLKEAGCANQTLMERRCTTTP